MFGSKKRLLLLLLLASCADMDPLADEMSAARKGPPGERAPDKPPVPPPAPPPATGGDPAPAVNHAVGRIDATVDVDPTGAARYSIPIKVPPGTLGVQPKISLGYRSRGSNDLAGVGFGIGGLSKIERCPQTMAQDENVGEIRFDADDRFCLDGLRLIAISGSYGADGTVYHTESQTWSKVVSYGVCKDQVQLPGLDDPVELSGPCTFEVTLKNGTMVTFGGDGSQCAALNEESPVRLSWPMTALKDLNSHTIEVEYQTAGINTCAPKEIRYTGNTKTNQTPLREVTFTYHNNRDDAVTTYRGGVPFSTQSLLEKIETWIRDSNNPSQKVLVKSYELKYGSGNAVSYSADTGRALLTQVTECDQTHVCLPPTTFDWTQGDWMTNSFLRQTSGTNQVPPIHKDVPLLSGDFNGDGHQDFLRIPLHNSSSGQYLAHHPGANEYGGTAWIGFDPDENPKVARFHAGDVDGDGFTDILWAGSADFDGPHGWRLFKGKPSGLSTTWDTSGSNPSLDDEIHLGDFTGDGRADLLSLENKNKTCLNNGTTFDGWKIFPSNGNGFGTPTSGTFEQGPFPVLWHSCDGGQDFWPLFHMADFNGDGRIDFLTTRRFADFDNPNKNSIDHVFHTAWRLYLSDGKTFNESAHGVWPHDPVQVDIGDFNGDGLSDVIVRGEGIIGQPGFVMLRSTGRTLEPILNSSASVTVNLLNGSTPFTMNWGTTGSSPNGCDEIQVANFNADGKDDVLVTSADCYQSSYDGAKMYISDGAGFSNVNTVVKPVAEHHLLARFQTHGRSGVMIRGLNMDVIYQIYSTPNPDLLKGVVDGIQAEIELEYGHGVTAIQHDAAAPIPAYPTRRYVGDFDYVGTLRRRNGDGAMHTSQYYYEGPKTDLVGRGFLGFERIQLTKQHPYRVLETYYHTDFPKAGLVKAQDNRAFYPNDFLQSRSEMFYTNKKHPSYPGVYNLVLNKEVTKKYTTNGTYVNSAEKAFSHDSYGFVTQVIDRADVAKPFFDLTTSTQYAHDPVAWQIGFPTEVRVFKDWHQPYTRRRTKYDPLRNIEFEERWEAATNTWLVTKHEYQVDGLRWRTTDPLGAKTEFEFDDYGFVSSTENALGHVAQSDHNPRFGNEIQRLDANGHITINHTDGFGQPTEIWAESPLNGNMIKIREFKRTTPGFGWITQSFVRRDWATSQSPEWDWTEEHRDGWGRPYRNRRRGEGTTAIAVDREYSGLDLVSKVSRPYFEGQAPEWTTYLYDMRGRVGKVTRLVDPVGAQTFFQHDGIGRITQTTTPVSVTQTAYDSLGRKTSVTDTDTGTTDFSYDAKGQLISETDAKGQFVARVYDVLGRTVQKSYYLPGGSTSAKTVVFGYDDPTLTNAIGQMSSAAVYQHGAMESEYAFAYDGAGHQTHARLEVYGRSVAWSKKFDPAGNVYEQNYPDGSILKTKFTSAGFLDELLLNEPTNPQNYFKSYANFDGHDAEARPNFVLYGNDVATCFLYDAQTKLLERTATTHFSQGSVNKCLDNVAHPGETPLIDLDYDWTTSNVVDRIEDQLVPSRSQSFGYDPDGALKTANGYYGAKTYTYQAGGNLHLKDGVFYTYFGHRPISGSDGSTFEYDLNGNLKKKVQGGSQWDFTWDTEDLLQQAVKDGRTTTFMYDFGGRRLVRRDDDGTSIYAGSSYEIFLDPSGDEFHTKYIDGPSGRIAQITEKNVMLVSNVRQRQYLALASMYDPVSLGGAPLWAFYETQAILAEPELERVGWLVGLTLIGACCLMLLFGSVRRQRQPRWQLVLSPALAFVFFTTYGTGAAEAAMNPGPQGAGIPDVGVKYFHQDHLGSTSVTTDDSGAEVARLLYEPYGRVHQASSSGTDDFRAKYTGQELDPSTDLYYYGARYYDPSTGRFISADRTVGAGVASGKAFNRYAYAKNNPVTYNDPSGEFIGFLVAMVVGFVVGGLIAGTNGKIFTDPAHAFDNWSWSRALFGAWVGMIVGGLTFGLGTIGTSSVTSGATAFGVPVGEVAAKTFAGAAVSTATEWASGERDAGSLAAYFGLGLFFSFVSGTKILGLAKSGLGKIALEASTSYTYSALKKTVNGEKPIQLTIWYFKIKVDKGGERELDVNEFFLVSQAAAMLINGWGFDEAARERMKESFSFEEMSYKIVDAKERLGWVSQLTALLAPSYGAPGAPSMTGSLTSMMKNLFHAATGPCKGGGCGFYDNIVKEGIDTGIGEVSGVQDALTTWSKEEFEEMYR